MHSGKGKKQKLIYANCRFFNISTLFIAIAGYCVSFSTEMSKEMH